MVTAAALAAAPAHAEGVYTSEAVGWEIAPFWGYRFGGGFDDEAKDPALDVDLENAPAYGLVVEFPSGHHTQWQIFYSRQDTEVHFSPGQPGVGDSVDLTIEYLHFGGTYVMEGNKDRPYVGFTFGASRFEPEGDFDDEVDFSIAFVGGVKYRLTRHVGLRFDVRGLGTLTNADGQFFCSGGCVARFQGDGFWQWDTTVGLNFYF